MFVASNAQAARHPIVLSNCCGVTVRESSREHCRWLHRPPQGCSGTLKYAVPKKILPISAVLPNSYLTDIALSRDTAIRSRPPSFY